MIRKIPLLSGNKNNIHRGVNRDNKDWAWVMRPLPLLGLYPWQKMEVHNP